VFATKTLLLAIATICSALSYAQPANRFDVVISEIMADPAPPVGLPNAEYIELRNVSATAFNLSGWRISDATGTATINTSFLLQPDSLVILCATTNVGAFSAFGRTIGVPSFPSLNNDGEVLTLRSPQNRVIHAVQYSSAWYGNDVKREGGWSLEMIDATNPCTGKENWSASLNALGGTPGKLNSINGTLPDTEPPRVKKTYAPDNVTVAVVFDEPLDSAVAAVRTNYLLPGFTVMSALPQPPLFHTVHLTLHTSLQPGIVYELTINHVADCKGNTIGAFNKIRAGVAEPAKSNDVVVNEILFNPRPGAYDFVEFYNRSKKIIDASKLLIANRNSSGAAAAMRNLSEEPFYLFSGDYLVVTQNKASLQKEYLVKNDEAVLTLSSMPSFPDDKGTVLLLTTAGDVVDEVAYDKAWHFALLNNPEGVSLERIHPDVPSQHKDSWHSAAATAGYGTPSYLNSQHNKTEATVGTIDVSPPVFSPDNDGRDDIATIRYQLTETGYLANVFIFDAAGRLVRHLAKNELLSLEGFWKWDGLGENQNKLPIGTYIVYTEIFKLDGKKKSFKNTVVLARRLN
jgi:hypothetical protein